MKHWYLTKKGRRDGPFSTDEIMEKIGAGNLGPFDLVMPLRGKEWLVLVELSDFANAFAKLEVAAIDNHWVVLKKEDVGGDRRFIQSRPLTEAQVLRALARGKVSYSDFIWRKGMKEWYRISFLKNFNPNPEVTKIRSIKSLEHGKEDGENPHEDLFNKVLVQPKIKEEIELAPDYVEGGDEVEAYLKELKEKSLEELNKPIYDEDLGGMTEAFEEKRDHAQRIGRDRRATQRGVDRRSIGSRRYTVWQELASYWREFGRGVSGAWWLPYLLVVIVGSIIGAAAVISSFPFEEYLRSEDIQKKMQNGKSTKVVEGSKGDSISQPSTDVKDQANQATVDGAMKQLSDQVRKEGDSKSGAAVPALPKKKKAPPRIKPTYFKVKTAGLSGNRAKLIFLTDGSSHYSVKLKWYGKAGKIVYPWGILREQSVSLAKSREVILRSLGIPKGYLQVVARLEGFERKIWLFVGSKGRKHDAALRQSRKRKSYWFQEERRELIDQASGFQNWAKSAGAKIRVNSKGSEVATARTQLIKLSKKRLNKVNPKFARKYIFPKEWVQMKEEYQKVLSALDGSSKKASGPPIGRVIRNFGKKMGQQKEKALAVSLWK